jgi:hypothetical protein
MQVSVDGLLCCTISNDRSVKIYDVVNYDMMFMMRLPFIPGAIEWVYGQGDVKPKLAVSDRNTSFVHIYDTHSGSTDPIISKEVYFVVAFCFLFVNSSNQRTFTDYRASSSNADSFWPCKSYEI